MLLSASARARPSAALAVARVWPAPYPRTSLGDRTAGRHLTVFASSTSFAQATRFPLSLLFACERVRIRMDDSAALRQRRAMSTRPGSEPAHDDAHSHEHAPEHSSHSHSHSHSHGIFGHTHSHDDPPDQTAEEVMKVLQGSGARASPSNLPFAVLMPRQATAAAASRWLGYSPTLV
jgi:hypothetical protein